MYERCLTMVLTPMAALSGRCRAGAHGFSDSGLNIAANFGLIVAIIWMIQLAGIFPVDQDAPLTDAEIDERRRFRAVFWAEVDIPPEFAAYMCPAFAKLQMHSEPLALEVAARTGDCEVVDLLLGATPKPDTKAWMEEYERLPAEPPSPSYLSPNTP